MGLAKGHSKGDCTRAKMAAGQLSAFLVYLTALFSISTCVQPTEEEYTLQKLLQDAIVNGDTDGASNLYVLKANFYPAQDQPPICIPVNYLLSCDSINDIAHACIDDDEHSLNRSFLWTQYDLTLPIGALLLSYASSGIILKGFDWEDACIYSKPFQLDLALNTSEQFNVSTLTAALLGITTQVGNISHCVNH